MTNKISTAARNRDTYGDGVVGGEVGNVSDIIFSKNKDEFCHIILAETEPTSTTEPAGQTRREGQSESDRLREIKREPGWMTVEEFLHQRRSGGSDDAPS